MRVKRKKMQAVFEKDNKMKEMAKEYQAEKSRQEKQIMELEKEKLEFDLKHKSQEMVNLMINFVRKNEMLTEIKSEILKVASSLKGESGREGKQQLLVLNNKIEANIQSDEVLKRIEDQFDLIHNNFMKRLYTKHPDLSNNERMMCAYLKMNLSTKEIAPLLNISVRGVETIRYRLRKKFDLERDESLVDYLNDLSGE
jgi:DNA-binding CsgD family transcriptional regulator